MEEAREGIGFMLVPHKRWRRRSGSGAEVCFAQFGHTQAPFENCASRHHPENQTGVRKQDAEESGGGTFIVA